MKIYIVPAILLFTSVFCFADPLDDEFESIISDFETKNKAVARMMWGAAKDNNKREEELQQINRMGPEVFESTLSTLLAIGEEQSAPDLYSGRPKEIPKNIWMQVVQIIHSRLHISDFKEDENRSVFVYYDFDLAKCEYYSEIRKIIPAEPIEMNNSKSGLDTPECLAFASIKTKKTIEAISVDYATIWMKTNNDENISLTDFNIAFD